MHQMNQTKDKTDLETFGTPVQIVCQTDTDQLVEWFQHNESASESC